MGRIKPPALHFMFDRQVSFNVPVWLRVAPRTACSTFRVARRPPSARSDVRNKEVNGGGGAKAQKFLIFTLSGIKDPPLCFSDPLARPCENAVRLRCPDFDLTDSSIAHVHRITSEPRSSPLLFQTRPLQFPRLGSSLSGYDFMVLTSQFWFCVPATVLTARMS